MPGNSARMQRGRRGNSRGRSVQSHVSRVPRHFNRVENSGIVGTGSSDPHRVVTTPWNTVTLTTLITGTSTPGSVCISVANLYTQLATQLGFSGTQTVAIRIFSNQVWHIIPNGELNNKVLMRYYSLTNSPDSCELVRTLCTIEDYGTPARNATVKFTWPLVSSNRVFASTATSVVMRHTLEASQQVLSHTRILWRFVGGSSTITKSINNKTVVEVDPLYRIHNEGDLEELLSTVVI